MNKQQLFLKKACSALSLECQIPYRINLADGSLLAAPACLPALGGPAGMLVFSEYEDIKGKEELLMDQGYGYTVYSIPSEKAEFDLEGYIEMFNDWGWNGSPSEAPEWFQEVTPESEKD